MKFVNVILFSFLNVIIYFSVINAQPLPHTDELKNEALDHMKNGRYGEAINLLNNYISARPQQAEGYNLRGLAYEHRGQYEESVYDLRSARKLEPQNTMILENLNRVTAEWYKLIYNNIEGYKREIAINPSKPVNYLQIGKSYKNLGQWVEAELWYDKYLEMEKASPDEIIRYTEILAKNDHIEKGEPILKKYTEEYPDDQRLWSRYGYFLLWLGKTKMSINAFEHALNLKPFFKEAMDGLARAKGNGYIYTFNDTATYKYYKFGIPKAPGYIIDIYFRKLKINPDDNETRIKLITELLKVKRYEEAYQQLLILQKTEGETAEFKLLQEKVITERENYYKEQITEFEKLYRENHSREVLLKLAGYYSSLGMYDKAVNLYSDYLTYFPNDAEIRFLYIQNSAWNKQFDLAGNELDVLILQYPDSLKYKLLRAQIYVWQNRDPDEAENLLNAVLKKDPGNFDALLTLAMLKFQQNDLKNAGYYASLANDVNPSSNEISRLEFEIKKQEAINAQNDLYKILEEARAKVEAKDCYGALNLYEKYNELTIPDKNILLEEADVYICLKDFNSAIRIYDNLLSKLYDYGVDKKRAKVIFWGNNPSVALEEFRKLYALHPEDQEVKMYIGDSYMQLKQYDKASQIYQELIAESPGSRLIQIRLGWLGEGGGNFLSLHFPTYIMVNPEADYYFDNFNFNYLQQGMIIEAGLNNYISIGILGLRGTIDSSNTSLNFYTAKGLLTLKLNRMFSSGITLGKTFFENKKDVLTGSAFLKAEDKNFNAGLEYSSQDAAGIFYSPLLVRQRLKTDIAGFSGEFHPASGLLVSGHINYYFISDGNEGGNFLFRLGKKFDEFAAGYEFSYMGFQKYSILYYSPANFQSHSLWGEWYILSNEKDELKIGGKVGIIPEDNFFLREAFASAKFLLVEHFALQGRITTGSTVRQNRGYSSTSFYISAYWTF